ncbi:hypothetical protein [Frankia sp. AgW1.1]|uniref:hypothetical protein n=1 Tax=Frankia sp. AgW1.1 TaxID=1836971 RepID=UPI001932B5F7|nr:hypothetical protein [Frankia sp. AgW1.1]MBL7494375.1 hypothetical protein [Frankia sp. AgW1.1]
MTSPVPLRALRTARDAWTLLSASVRLAREVEPGAVLAGLTLQTITEVGESVLYAVDLSARPVTRVVEIITADGVTLVNLDDTPWTAEGASDE